MSNAKIADAGIVVTATLKFPPDRVKDAIAKLKPIISEKFAAQEGYIAYEIATDCSDPGLIRCIEYWANRELLMRHSTHPDSKIYHAANAECGLIDQQYIICDIFGDLVHVRQSLADRC